MGAGLDGAFLEGGQQTVGVAPVALLGQDHHINQVGNPAAEPEPEAPDPVADLVAENKVAFIERAGPAGRILFLLEDLGEPGREVLVLFHVSNRQLAHLPPPSSMGDSHPSVSNTNATPAVPVGEGDHAVRAAPRTTVPATSIALDFCEANLQMGARVLGARQANDKC